MRTQNRLFFLSFLLVGAASLAACNNPPAMQADTGPVGTDTGPTGTDAGTDGGGSGSVCDAPLALTLAAGPAQHISGDTTGHTTGLVMLGAGCGGQTAGPQMAEQVIELTLPGTASDTVAVSFTFLNAGTNMMFDTVTELRTSCSMATDQCFDDSSAAQDYRSDGVFTAPGGSTRYLVVSGYRMPEMGYTNVGAWQADFTTYLNPQPPTLTSGEATLLDGDYLTVRAQGMDPQSAAVGVIFTYLDAANMPIGLDLDADPTTPDETELGPYDFRPGVVGMMTFDGTSRITGWGPFTELATATQLRLSVIDGAELTSNELMVPLVHAMTVHVGDACDASHVCAAGVDCTGTPAVCTVPAAVATACAAATPLTIAMPTTTATSATAMVTLTTGMGLLEGSCVGTGGMGDEHIYTVDVPAVGAYDLIASTPDMGEMGLDSMIYDRSVCGDPASEIQCNDDRSTMPHSLASLVTENNAAAGTHFLVLDAFETLTAMDPMMTTLTVTLRPVLLTGTPCDPAGVMNRCMGGACPATGTAMCP